MSLTTHLHTRTIEVNGQEFEISTQFGNFVSITNKTRFAHVCHMNVYDEATGLPELGRILEEEGDEKAIEYLTEVWGLLC